MLDPIQNQGLRTCLGAFRTSPAESLYVEADESPLYLRREQLALQYAAKIASFPSNPVHDCIFKPSYGNLYVKKPTVILPFGLRHAETLEELGIHPNNIEELTVPPTPPWTYPVMGVNFTLGENKKDETSPVVFHSAYAEIKAFYPDYKYIYTDGSKNGDRVAAAAIIGNDKRMVRLPNGSSVFTAELQAISLALKKVEVSIHKKFVIFSDSKSCLQAIQNKDWKTPAVQKVLELYNFIHKVKEKVVVFCWIPSHIGIKGNEKADKAAKEALNYYRFTRDKMHYSDLKPNISQHVRNTWQVQWDQQVHNKLHSIQPTLGRAHGYSLTKKEEVILARIRIGHTFLTHMYLLKGEDQPECVGCQHPLTVKHILLDCIDFSHIRSKYYNVSSMSELFDKIHPTLILNYLREAGLFNKL